MCGSVKGARTRKTKCDEKSRNEYEKSLRFLLALPERTAQEIEKRLTCRGVKMVRWQRMVSAPCVCVRGDRKAGDCSGDRGRRTGGVYYCRLRLGGANSHGTRRGFPECGVGKRGGVLGAVEVGESNGKHLILYICFHFCGRSLISLNIDSPSFVREYSSGTESAAFELRDIRRKFSLNFLDKFTWVLLFWRISYIMWSGSKIKKERRYK